MLELANETFYGSLPGIIRDEYSSSSMDEVVVVNEAASPIVVPNQKTGSVTRRTNSITTTRRWRDRRHDYTCTVAYKSSLDCDVGLELEQDDFGQIIVRNVTAQQQSKHDSVLSGCSIQPGDIIVAVNHMECPIGCGPDYVIALFYHIRGALSIVTRTHESSSTSVYDPASLVQTELLSSRGFDGIWISFAVHGSGLKIDTVAAAVGSKCCALYKGVEVRSINHTDCDKMHPVTAVACLLEHSGTTTTFVSRGAVRTLKRDKESITTKKIPATVSIVGKIRLVPKFLRKSSGGSIASKRSNSTAVTTTSYDL